MPFVITVGRVGRSNCWLLYFNGLAVSRINQFKPIMAYRQKFKAIRWAFFFFPIVKLFFHEAIEATEHLETQDMLSRMFY